MSEDSFLVVADTTDIDLGQSQSVHVNGVDIHNYQRAFQERPVEEIRSELLEANATLLRHQGCPPDKLKESMALMLWETVSLSDPANSGFKADVNKMLLRFGDGYEYQWDGEKLSYELGGPKPQLAPPLA